MSTKINHEFVPLDEKERKNDSSYNSPNNAVAIVVIGKTGAGKSSLINLFCNAATIGHSTTSQTTSSSLYQENNQRYWLDSQGASDSNGVPDDKVLCDVLKALYDKSITKIKIIWCVSDDTQARANKEFQKQAGFIKNGIGDKKNSVWNSCLIIKKQGDPKPTEGLDGLLAAASMSGSDISYGGNRLFGYSFYDENVKLADHTLNKALKFITDSRQRAEFLKDAGFWSKSDIKTETNLLLSKLPTSTIQFNILKCSKCSSKGDPRFVYEKCHVASEQYHSGELTPYHPEVTIKYHPATAPQAYHPKDVIKFHPGSVETRYHHPGSKKSVYYHTKGSYWNYLTKGDTVWRWKCCERHKFWSDGSKKDNGCTFSHDYWTCCNYSGSSGPCSSYDVYSCCSRSPSSEGCKTGFGCCLTTTLTDRGCTKKYICCNKSIDNAGCIEKYPCCQAPSDHKGCKIKYSCCDKESDEVGCIKRCSNASCHKEWGKGPGCMTTESK